MMEAACQKFLQTGDSDVFLIAVSEHVNGGRIEEVTDVLLGEAYQPLLSQLGWDVITVLSPYLTTADSPGWRLIQHITKVCSPKEMLLALLEQMEQSSDPILVFIMLRLLQKVLLSVKTEKAVVSSLRSACGIIRRHYQRLEYQEERPRNQGTEEEESEEEEVESVDSEEDTKSMDVLRAASETLDFVRPFVDLIHYQHCSAPYLMQSFWGPRQRECVSLLLSLLDYPFITHNLKNSDSQDTAERIMKSVVKCHCGCVELMEWTSGEVQKRQRSNREPIPEDSSLKEEETVSLPPLGQACFSYLLLSEKIENSYLPSVVSPVYLLQVNVSHATALIERPERKVTLKGLALLKALVRRVPSRSLSSHLLDNKKYLQLAELLTNVMVTCPHKSVRQQSVQLLLDMIQCFNDTGRHRMYRSLFHSVHHAGVLGLLTHSIKNEVDQALKAASVPSPFRGPDLVPLLTLILTVSHDSDMLKESDRIMAALNFLRYLLIRDKPQHNQTCIWSELWRLRDQFVSPLRSGLMAARAHCTHEAEDKREGPSVSEPEVTVEVMGQKLPHVTPHDRIRVLKLALFQLDMMESVLVRVEELMEYS